MPKEKVRILLRCPKCQKPTRLLERLWSPQTGSYVRMFKCECGELVWDD